MPEKTQVAASEIMNQKTALQAKLKDLLGAAFRNEDLHIQSFADPLDQIRSDQDRDMAINQLDLRARLVREVRAALDAIHDGTYGLCVSCDEPISPKRLKALPWARLCVRCQTEAESVSRHRSSVLEDAA